MTKVIIADDHQLVLDGICSHIKNFANYSIVGTASNGAEVLKLLETITPDIVITDIDMPQMNGIDLATTLKKNFPKIKVMVITMHIELWVLKKITKAGVKVILSKSANTDEFEIALNALSNNINYVSPDIKEFLTDSALKTTVKQSNYFNIRITDRESDIIKLIVEEKTNKQIAQILDISVNTVETFRKIMYQKIGVTNMAGVTKFAIERGLV